MFDATRLSVLAFEGLKILVVALMGLLVFSLLRRALSPKYSVQTHQKGQYWRFAALLLLLVVWVGLLSYNETVYRPKTTLRPANPALEQTLKDVDAASTPTPTPAPTPTPTWEERAQKNRQENDEARTAFETTAPDRKK